MRDRMRDPWATEDDLARCEHCGARIAADAGRCPQCGGRTSRRMALEMVWVLCALIVLAAGAASLIFAAH